MARHLPDRAKRRAIFLEALATGSPVAQAAAHARLAWTTLYKWRRTEAKFRAAWDAALKTGAEAMAARFDSEMVRRAVDGVDEPVFHNGAVVGERRRYSDPLLMFGIRDLRHRQHLAARANAGGPAAAGPRVTVIIDPVEGEDE